MTRRSISLFGRSLILNAANVVLLTLSLCHLGFCQTGTLSEPFPTPSPNAALHYQRALLHLAALDESDLKPLDRPIWTVLPEPADQAFPQEFAGLLQQTRFAIRSAATGSRTAACNFGIDFHDLGAATQLPHAKSMVELGRLLTLRGAQAESGGDWEEAAILYFDGLRMGRHLTHQETMLEGLAGIEVLRNNYFALARWGARCPSRPLVARVFGLLETTQASLVNPPQMLARESSILLLEFERLVAAFPRGNWAEMILDSYGVDASGDRDQDRLRAIEASVKRGVPKEVFANSVAFHQYVGSLRVTGKRFAESLAACMTLPPQARLRRAESLGKKYAKLIKVLATDALIDPVDAATIFAEHEAELTLTRLALAISASKADGKFPAKLDAVSARFGGEIPADPYNNKPVEYQTQDTGRAFSLLVPAFESLPAVDFNSRSPVPAN